MRSLRGQTRGDELSVRVILIMDKQRVLNANILQRWTVKGI
jgi:hypothetical protein